MTQSIQNQLSQLDEWINQHYPGVNENLCPGASAEEIQAVENNIGVLFPEELKELYQWHNGEKNNYPPNLFPNYDWFIPLKDVIEYTNTMSEFEQQTSEADFPAWKASIEEEIISVRGPVKPVIFTKYRIPFLDSNGDVQICVDLDPAPGGTVGQIIEVYNEACSYQVLARSLPDFLETFIERLHTGYYHIDEDDSLVPVKEDDDETPWGMPDYLKEVEYTYIDENDVSEPIDLAGVNEGEEIILIGEMSTLGSSLDVTNFGLIVKSGQEYGCIATASETKGYASISVLQFAKIRAIVYQHGRSSMTAYEKNIGHIDAELYVLEYEMLKTKEDFTLYKKPWWKFW